MAVGMQLWYGNLAFPVNGVKAATRVRLVMADTGRPLRYKAAIDVKAYLDGSGEADLTVKENLVYAALLVPYQNLVLKQSTGAATGTNLLNSASISGVRIVDGPNFTNEAQDGEYVVQRVCTFTGEAEYLIAVGANAVLSFTETVSIFGNGGPVVRWRPMVNADPVPQIVYPSSTTRAVQTGQAVGHLGYPSVPGPNWPIAELNEKRRIVRGSPKRLGSGFIEYPVAWSYEFEALGPLVSLPNLPPP
jgi:hypothetical protein